MTDEEMNRKMEFIVEQQAIFAADIEILKERQDRFQGQLEALGDLAHAAIESSTRTAEIVASVIEAMGVSQDRAERQISRIARLTEMVVDKAEHRARHSER